MKIWTSHEKGDDKIIAFENGNIYRGYPKKDEIETVARDFQNQKSGKHFTEIPLRYLKEINVEDNRDYIEILFGQESSEHLRIKDQIIRNQIFEYFKANLPQAKTDTTNYSKWQAGKKPLIAMAVVTAIFLWTFYIAKGIESGNEYGVTGDHKGSLAGIVLALASMGSVNVMLLFGLLLATGVLSFVLKTRKPKVVHRIIVRV